MASAKATVSNILDTVSATSNTVCNTINIVNDAATYGSKWMKSVLAQQEVAIKANNEMFATTYVEAKAVELSNQRLAISAWVNQNPQNKEMYELSLAQLKAAIAK